MTIQLSENFKLCEPREVTICFTGHRPDKLAGYEKSGYTVLVNYIADVVEYLHKQYEVRHVITGGAQGLDQSAFWATNIVKNRHSDWVLLNELYAPFWNQESRWNDTGLFSKHEYKLMRKYADNTYFVYDGVAGERWEAVRKLNNRNHEMVDDSWLLLALHNPDTEDSGGTVNCINYARNVGVPIMYLPYIVENNMVVPLVPVEELSITI